MINIKKLFNKAERGTHKAPVKVTRDGKTFYQQRRVGRKDIYPVRQPEKNITQVEAGKTYTGKLYHSTSINNAENIEKEGFQTKGKLADRYTPEQREGAQTWSKYGFIYFNNDMADTQKYGDATFEVDVKNLRVAGGIEYTDVLVKYQGMWSKKIESAIDEHGFNSDEVKKLYAEREGKKDSIMTDLVTKEFNKKYDGMIGMPGDIIITNPNIIKNITRIK